MLEVNVNNSPKMLISFPEAAILLVSDTGWGCGRYFLYDYYYYVPKKYLSCLIKSHYYPINTYKYHGALTDSAFRLTDDNDSY